MPRQSSAIIPYAHSDRIFAGCLSLSSDRFSEISRLPTSLKFSFWPPCLDIIHLILYLSCIRFYSFTLSLVLSRSIAPSPLWFINAYLTSVLLSDDNFLASFICMYWLICRHKLFPRAHFSSLGLRLMLILIIYSHSVSFQRRRNIMVRV